jgi:hypothetical protein
VIVFEQTTPQDRQSLFGVETPHCVTSSKGFITPKLHSFFGESLEVVLFHHDFGQGVEVDWVCYAIFEQFDWIYH